MEYVPLVLRWLCVLYVTAPQYTNSYPSRSSSFCSHSEIKAPSNTTEAYQYSRDSFITLRYSEQSQQAVQVPQRVCCGVQRKIHGHSNRPDLQQNNALCSP